MYMKAQNTCTGVTLVRDVQLVRVSHGHNAGSDTSVCVCTHLHVHNSVITLKTSWLSAQLCCSIFPKHGDLMAYSDVCTSMDTSWISLLFPSVHSFVLCFFLSACSSPVSAVASECFFPDLFSSVLVSFLSSNFLHINSSPSMILPT